MIHDHLFMLASLGGATLLAAWMPAISKKLRVSGTVLLLLVGFCVFAIGTPLAWPDPFWPDSWIMKFTEAIVIISLMSAGLKVGRSYKYENWRGPLRMLVITMPLCIIAGVLLGHYLIGLPIETAMLLGAVLAPTDPVMASEVQIEPTSKASDYNPIRFSLTGEASLNDGLAFPFTWLAVLLSQAGGVWGDVDWSSWVLDKVLLKIGLGLLIGAAAGYLIGKLLEELPRWLGIRTRDGFVAFSATFLIYAGTEMLHGYGFLAVFIAGVVIRWIEESYAGDEMKYRLHDFVSEIERLLLAVFLILFGGSIINGLLSGLQWEAWAFAVAFIFLIRPLAGWLGLIGIPFSERVKWSIAFLGIRGIGSLFYLSWAFVQTDFPAKPLVYQTLNAVILLSLVTHGLSARTLLSWANPEEDDERSYEVDGPVSAETRD